MTQVVKLRVIIKNPFTDLSNYKVIKALKYALEIETETDTKLKSVMGIETLLDTMSIALQNKRERNQDDLSKQMASAIPPLVKDKKPQVLSV